MDVNGIGPYGSVQLVTAGHGLREINDLLQRGWTLLATQIVEEIIEGGPSRRRQISQWTTIGIMGRALGAEENLADAQEQANETGEDALAQTQTVRLAADDDTDGAADAEAIPSGTLHVGAQEEVTAPPIAAKTRGARRINTDQPGETKVTGLRG